MKPVKKKDVPQGLIDALQAQYPGCKILAAGDGPLDDMPAPVIEAMNQLQKRMKESLEKLICATCGKPYPRTQAAMKQLEQGRLLKGWGLMRDISAPEGSPPDGLLCPDC